MSINVEKMVHKTFRVLVSGNNNHYKDVVEVEFIPLIRQVLPLIIFSVDLFTCFIMTKLKSILMRISKYFHEFIL